MTALLTDNLPLLAGAPNGIKKLRELILELAVRGKLVPQDANDEPASELLKRIAEEKARLVAEGKIKRSKLLVDINELDKPYELPAGWSWTTLPGAASYQIGKTPPTKESKFWDDSGQAWVSISDMEHYGEINDTSRKVSVLAQQNVFKYPPIPAGTLLMSFKLTVGKVSILAVDAYHNEAIISLSPFCGVSKDYLFSFLPSIALGGQQKNALMGNTLNSESMAQLLIPIPPLAEQHRIVAKVDELMALCDRMEARQADADSAHAQLVQALLDSLTQARDAEDFAQSWQRLAEHFHTLFTTESSIDALKQTLLQLAVMGKLVPQDSSDEPASELLVRLTNDRNDYAAIHKVAVAKPEPISGSDQSLSLPNGWAWARLCSMFRVITDGDHQPPPKSTDGIAFLTIGNVTKGYLDFSNCRFVPQDYFDRVAIYRRPETGDILYTVVGATYGRPIAVNSSRDFCVQRHIAILKSSKLISPAFACYLLASPWIYEQATQSTTGTAQPTIPLKPLRNFLVMLPPLPEQHRIVAKVDQLMALCDQLKARLNQARQVHEQLATALVEQAVA
ncbi:restriction endonuclease subunit S [Ectopseudomonas toyotomiensis]|uniref:Restriction endonuclease subunit S n=1 Tax=Ectopseudomonas toyotomiensis TaxID=554344 RepID=A0ABD7DZR6_9GAMM|nr:restriction endonuclease subunit S [Pseudomonas toyotomiensis]QSL93956.1 restriction endonuclease subunit S [Pseudomonas toyotomiensis]